MQSSTIRHACNKDRIHRISPVISKPDFDRQQFPNIMSKNFIVDDDPAITDSLQFFLEQHEYSVATFSSGDEMIQTVSPDDYGVVVLDVRIPGSDGLQILHQLNIGNYHVKTIMITGHGDIPMAVRAMKEGAIEFLEKPFHPQALLQAIEDAMSDNSGTDILKFGTQPGMDRFQSLGPRERLILNGIVRGESNKKMADQLGVSLRTIQFGRSEMFRKLEFRNRGELMDWIVANNIDLKFFHQEDSQKRQSLTGVERKSGPNAPR